MPTIEVKGETLIENHDTFTVTFPQRCRGMGFDNTGYFTFKDKELQIKVLENAEYRRR
jgi:hypothetical protein